MHKFFLINKYLIKNIFLLLFVMLILHHQNFFKNFYEILTKNYNLRMLIAHGDCSKRAYGFLTYVKKNYNLVENPLVHNFNTEPDTAAVWVNNVIKQKSLNNIILLNFEGKIENEINLNGHNLKFSDYVLTYKKSNCFYFSKK